MLVDHIENNIYCNGKLGNFFNLLLRISHEEINNTHKISLKLKLSKTKNISNSDLDTNIKLTENQVTARLRVADKVLIKKSLPIDFSSDLTTNINLLEYEYEINNEQPLIMNYYGDIIIDNDESNYITTTSIKSDLFLKSLKQDKLFIDLINLNKIEYNSNSFSVNTTVTPDFLEYKVNSDKWIKFMNNSFFVPISNKPQIIQVRGKKDDYYSYSNSIRIDPDLTIIDN